MSDYGDGDYDDFEDDFHDMLYDADPNPELADDLAEHTLHSPLWQDDPSEELRDYFSDWDYYSDDYFDDDPALLNGPELPQSKRNRRPEDGVAHETIRKRKRQLSDTGEQPDLKRHATDALRACLRGTVWKSDSPDRTVVFDFGAEDAVALRLNDEVMQAAYNREHGFGKGRQKRDESWANDLSLADMGLKPEGRMGVHEQREDTENDDEEDDIEQEAEQVAIKDEQDDNEYGIGVDEEVARAQVMVEQDDRIELRSELTSRATGEVQEEQLQHKKRGRKRRKLSDAEAREEPILPTPDASLESDIDEDVQQVEQESAAITSKAAGRKRKLSLSSATASTASSRAKRIAVSNATPDEKGIVKTAAASRPTRNRKKAS